MLTVLEAIKLSTDYLEKKGIESPRTNAELLLADILTCKRIDLYLAFDRPLKDEEVAKYRESISRRGKFEPLQYIIGSVEFFGLNFKVNSSSLIPRPETEILLETIINENMNPSKILDIGTGSGNISICLAKQFPNSQTISVDISDKSIELAKQNAELNSVANVDFLLMNILTDVFTNGEKFDLIVSNPPYISHEEYSALQKEILEYEPVHALTDGGDGLTFYKRITELSANLLNEKGKLFFELGNDQSIVVEKILVDYGFKEIKVVKDLQNIDRIIYGALY